MKNKYSYSERMKAEMRETRDEKIIRTIEALRPVWKIIGELIVTAAIAALFAYCLLMWFTEPSLNGTY